LQINAEAAKKNCIKFYKQAKGLLMQ
jgi:hypothetical protein